MIKSVENKLTRARVDLIYDQPFFGNLILMLEFKEDSNCKTVWTDGKYIGYNNEFIDKLKNKEIVTVLAHEVLHIILFHHLRRKNRKIDIWQIATDYAINLILEENKFSMLKNMYIDHKFKEMTAEEIYNNLIKDSEFKDNEFQNIGEIRDADNELSENEITKLEQEWKVNIIQSVQLSKSIGKLPGFMNRLVKDILEPKADWKEILKIFVENSAKEDYTWFPSNRRYIHKNLYLPSLISENLPDFIVVMDTSGSINNDILNQFTGEINSMLEDYKSSCIIIYCDAKVKKIEEFSFEDIPIKLNPKGGGGTSFIPPFNWIEKNNIDPIFLIYLTDLQSKRFPSEPTYPVLWAKIGSFENKPPFGVVIELTERN